MINYICNEHAILCAVRKRKSPVHPNDDALLSQSLISPT